MATYQLSVKDKEAYIKCLGCGMISYNQSDIKNLYCGHCHIFHTDISNSVDTDSKNFSIDEVKRLLFYGTPSHESEIKIDDEGNLDYAVLMMFDLLEKYKHFNYKEVERVFWERIRALANYR